MLEVAKIKTAIEELPEKDFVQLRQWLWEKVGNMVSSS